MKLSELIQQKRFVSPGEESTLNVVVTGSWVVNEIAAATAPFGITPAQYNVLRILRGSHPRKLTCSEIGARLLDRTPDVTRLLNRLERSGLIGRRRSDEDRRVVEVTILEAGLDLLEKMQAATDATMERITRHLTPEEHQQLTALLEKFRTDQTA